tara:strand:- start:334 stop:522 length:189 start_codon:yes stop_codon:yes gene_type:complete
MSSDNMKRQKELIAHLEMLKERESGIATSKEKASKPQDRKYKTKGSNYKPGRARVRKKRLGE